MYNDEHNLYHYTYRKDGSETETHPVPQAGPAPEYQNGPQQPVQEMKPVKKNRVGMKLTALALCCAFLALMGGGILCFLRRYVTVRFTCGCSQCC